MSNTIKRLTRYFSTSEFADPKTVNNKLQVEEVSDLAPDKSKGTVAGKSSSLGPTYYELERCLLKRLFNYERKSPEAGR